MASILVTGASRGIGHAFVAHLLELPVSQFSLVWAAVRDVEHPILQELSHQHPKRLRILQLDITNDTSVTDAAKRISLDSPNGCLDILVNSAAVIGEKVSITELSTDDLRASLETNALGCHSVTRAFLPLLKKGNKKTVVNLSAALASMGMESEFPLSIVGSVAAYRVSKTALNMLTRQWALALGDEGFTVAALHPGWIRTDMGGPYAPITPNEAAESMARFVLNLDGSCNGKFFRLMIAQSNENSPGQETIREMPW